MPGPEEIAAGAAMRHGASQAHPLPPKRGIIVAVVAIALLVLAGLDVRGCGDNMIPTASKTQ